MTNEPENLHTSRKLRLGAAFIAVVLSLLGVEALYYFAAPQDPDQKALARWDGVPAPDFSVSTLDGQVIQLSGLKGRRVILNFWATWCPPCRQELPDFIRLRTEAPTNVVILGLSGEDEDTLKRFVKDNGINYPIAALKSIPSPYQDIAKIPVTMVVDRNGVIQHAVLGAQSFETLSRFAAEPDFGGHLRSPPQPDQGAALR